MKKNGLVWNFLEPQAVETSDHTNKTNKYLHHPNKYFEVIESSLLYTYFEVILNAIENKHKEHSILDK